VKHAGRASTTRGRLEDATGRPKGRVQPLHSVFRFHSIGMHSQSDTLCLGLLSCRKNVNYSRYDWITQAEYVRFRGQYLYGYDPVSNVIDWQGLPCWTGGERALRASTVTDTGCPYWHQTYFCVLPQTTTPDQGWKLFVRAWKDVPPGRWCALCALLTP